MLALVVFQPQGMCDGVAATSRRRGVSRRSIEATTLVEAIGRLHTLRVVVVDAASMSARVLFVAGGTVEQQQARRASIVAEPMHPGACRPASFAIARVCVRVSTCAHLAQAVARAWRPRCAMALPCR